MRTPHRLIIKSAAAELLERAQHGEFTLQLPNLCLGEARQAIRTKCQPRAEANAIRRFLSWATPAGNVTPEDAGITRTILDKYEGSIQKDLDKLDDNLKILAGLPCIDIFGLDDTMIDRATALALAGIAPKPFDHAVLGGILVTAHRLWESGGRGLSFCEADADLQPWGRYGDAKPELRAAYDQAHVWVYSDFTVNTTARLRINTTCSDARWRGAHASCLAAEVRPGRAARRCTIASSLQAAPQGCRCSTRYLFCCCSV